MVDIQLWVGTGGSVFIDPRGPNQVGAGWRQSVAGKAEWIQKHAVSPMCCRLSPAAGIPHGVRWRHFV